VGGGGHQWAAGGGKQQQPHDHRAGGTHARRRAFKMEGADTAERFEELIPLFGSLENLESHGENVVTRPPCVVRCGTTKGVFAAVCEQTSGLAPDDGLLSFVPK
jgi:hypothetical protein